MNVLHKYINFSGNFIGNFAHIGSEVIFNNGDPNYIEFENETKRIIKFEFTLPDRRYKFYKLVEGKHFKKDQIKKISSAFELNVKSQFFNKDFLQVFNPEIESKEYLNLPIYCVEVENKDEIYLCLYISRGDSPFVNNIYYIIGIYRMSHSISPKINK